MSPFPVVLAIALAGASLPAGPLAQVTLADADGDLGRRAFEEGLAAARAGELADAEQRLATATALLPGWALAHLELGLVRLARDPQDAAGLVELEEAVRLAPENPRARLQLGLAYARLGRATDAQTALRAALAARSDLVDAHQALAGLYADAGAWPEAVAEYQAVLGRQPDNLSALSGLAVAAERSGDLERAEWALVAITRLLPSIPYHLYRLAEFYERTGQPARAKGVHAQLEALDPRQRRLRKLK